MIAADPIAPEAGALAEVKAYLRIEQDGEDEVISRLIVTAVGHAEGFTGQALIMREVRETLPVGTRWQRLGRTPVSGISGVEGVSGQNAPVALAVDAYAIDIDAAGDGWVRIVTPGPATRAIVHYVAGLAEEWAGLPEALRQGVVRLASHLYAHRDAEDEGAPPAAVAALWRPWRRMRLA